MGSGIFDNLSYYREGVLELDFGYLRSYSCLEETSGSFSATYLCTRYWTIGCIFQLQNIRRGGNGTLCCSFKNHRNSVARCRTSSRRLIPSIFFQLIRYLPESYQGIVQSIYRWDNNDFKFEHVLSELLAEESRLKQCKKDLNLIDTNHLALKTKAHKTKNIKLKSGNFKKSENKIGPCFSCHKMGQLISNCKEKLKSSKYQSDNNFTIEACIDQEVNANDYTWIFDTAASTHFCNNKKLFVSCEPVNNTTVTCYKRNN
ncbi:retrovirus-related Pol polyprotein from transposon TNT 1-94 [Trichonephila clavipes]|nr:retrovirus-related Pol polyprotein from transposon TNT 1-94 [Trichonephila clavipes]